MNKKAKLGARSRRTYSENRLCQKDLLAKLYLACPSRRSSNSLRHIMPPLQTRQQRTNHITHHYNGNCSRAVHICAELPFQSKEVNRLQQRPEFRDVI